ncbi:mitochondrial 37S ribosomal protein uS5m, partial [Aspergillus lucknowensis]
MSFTRPARCLICSLSRAASAAGPRVPRRQFQVSAAQFSDNKSNSPGDKKVRSRTLEQLRREVKPEDFKPYTEKEKAHLRTQYTPEQIAAIEAGEAAIDPKDMASQFAIRQDPLAFHYLDDFSVIEPAVDKHIRAPESNTDYNATLKTEDDFVDDFAKFFADMPDDFTVADWVRFAETNRVTIGKEENELNPHSSLVPDLFGPGENLEGRTEKPPKYYDDGESQAPAEEEIPDALRTLMKVTGYTKAEIADLKVRVVVERMVSNQTRLGKIRSNYFLAIAGNGNGLLGIGEGKSEEGGDATLQAKYRAIRSMKPIPRYENRTIYGDVKGKVGAVELQLMSRPPGFGLRCQSLIYEMCRAAGIKDLAARVGRSRNAMNTVKAAYEALMTQRIPEDVARARGKKLVDVRKVYYSGRTDGPRAARL